jgi:cysteine desulfurase
MHRAVNKKQKSATKATKKTTTKKSQRPLTTTRKQTTIQPTASSTSSRAKQQSLTTTTTRQHSAPATNEDASEHSIKTSKGSVLQGRSIYLDTQATTPLDPRVLDAMLPFMTQQYGNPHSRTHHFGWEADDAVEVARGHIAKLIGASSPSEIIFTSGATESNNQVIKGLMRFLKGSKKHLITVQTEHKCVLDSARALQQEGFEVTYLPVKPDGLIDLQLLEQSIRPDTGLVSIMAVNNEIGTIQPLKDIATICKSKGVKFHTDGAQAVGKIPLNVEEMGIDAMSISSHKLYGPKGLGAMYVRRRPRVRLEPIISGGGQERGLRSGTLAPPLCVGMGEACRIAGEEMARDTAHINRLAKKMMDGLSKELSHLYINGPPIGSAERYNGNLNISFAHVEGESLLMGLKQIAVSSGSACTSASLEPSYVLRALGVEEDLAHTSIRFGIGRFTTDEEVDQAIKLTINQVQRLREMSPLWEMVQEGIDPSTIQWKH